MSLFTIITGMLNIVNQLFKIYFKVNKLHLCKPLIRAIESSSLKDKLVFNLYVFFYYIDWRMHPIAIEVLDMSSKGNLVTRMGYRLPCFGIRIGYPVLLKCCVHVEPGITTNECPH